MYLSSLIIKNFRCFDASEHIINFNPGLTVLVGENDSGKSAIMDAIKIVLGTTDFSWNHIEVSDFHQEDTDTEINIVCMFSQLTLSEEAAFVECLTYELVESKRVPCLYLHWKCKYLSSFRPPRPIVIMNTGKDGNGPALSAESRELLRVTYLRALRDAYSNMQSGKHSRLSQIIQNIPDINKGEDEYQHEMDLNTLSLVGITNLSNSLLNNHAVLALVTKEMTQILDEQMLLKTDSLKTHLEVAGANSDNLHKLVGLLEKLDLAIDKDTGTMFGKVGLGTSNVMSMACELLLNKEIDKEKSSFLLIEEPEAHIHAQRQLKLVQSLEKEVEGQHQQIILTTHSPLLASVVKLGNIIIVKNGQVFPLAKKYTKLGIDDYKFLERYLDATKANMFFARNIIIVEGPGEALLLPTLAKLLDRNFIDYGTSLVDVRSTGLRRYARIFQRAGNEKQTLNVNVACVTDRDIMPVCAPLICIDDKYGDKSKWPEKSKRRWRVETDFDSSELHEYIKEIKEKADGQTVKTFVADHWTLEYDLAYAGIEDQVMKKSLIDALVKVSYVKCNWESNIEEINKMIESYGRLEEKAAYFYQYFSNKTTSKAEFAQQFAFELEENSAGQSTNLKKLLPKYLVQAIEYVTEG